MFLVWLILMIWFFVLFNNFNLGSNLDYVLDL